MKTVKKKKVAEILGVVGNLLEKCGGQGGTPGPCPTGGGTKPGGGGKPSGGSDHESSGRPLEKMKQVDPYKTRDALKPIIPGVAYKPGQSSKRVSAPGQAKDHQAALEKVGWSTSKKVPFPFKKGEAVRMDKGKQSLLVIKREFDKEPHTHFDLFEM